MRKYTYKRGDSTLLARELKISRKHIYNIRKGKATASSKLAQRLEDSFYGLFGFRIPAEAWMLPFKYSNPFVKGRE